MGWDSGVHRERVAHGSTSRMGVRRWTVCAPARVPHLPRDHPHSGLSQRLAGCAVDFRLGRPGRRRVDMRKRRRPGRWAPALRRRFRHRLRMQLVGFPPMRVIAPACCRGILGRRRFFDGHDVPYWLMHGRSCDGGLTAVCSLKHAWSLMSLAPSGRRPTSIRGSRASPGRGGRCSACVRSACPASSASGRRRRCPARAGSR